MSDAQPIRRKGITLGVRRTSVEDFSEEVPVIEENFPKHRTLHLKPNDGTAQNGDRVDIVVTEEVLLATAHHVAQDMSKESGGFLLGNRYICPNTNRQYIVIDQFMKADYTEGTQVSLTFTTDSWAQLKDRLDGKYRGKQLLGWYHSHPGMGIFLSNYDLDIHKNRFADEWDVALVLDPVKHEGGFFAWIDGNINPRERLDFYELLDGDARETVVAWTNYIAEDPKTGAPATLKTVNTQSSETGLPAASPASRRAQAVSPAGLLSNPYAVAGGAAALILLLIGTVLASYFMFFRNSGNAGNESNVDNQIVKNKVLDGGKIRVGKDLKGFVSSDNKMTVDLQITGIGDTEVIEEIRKDNNLQIEINGQATTLSTETVNGSVLKARAVTALPAEMSEAFNADKSQEFAMNVDMFYNGDVVEKKVETKFQKGKGANPTPSLGDLVAFGEVVEKNVAPKKRTKPEISEKPNTDNDKPQPPKTSSTSATKKKSPSDKNTTTTDSTKKTGTAISDETGLIKGAQKETNDLLNKGKNKAKQTRQAIEQ